jgi:photosystem II stability/assembly factor-like uncharacterized protein
VDIRSIIFSDPKHGWLWFGGGAMGSMSVDLYDTRDGGQHWRRIACAAFSNPLPGHGCPFHSGIGLGGDKEFLTFSNSHDGWLTVFSNGGVPELLRSADGGRTWHYQWVGLPPGVQLPGPHGTVFPMGTFDAPRIFGREGVLAEVVGFFRQKPQTNWAYLYLFRSHDGGRTWNFFERTPIPEPALSQYIDARRWVFAASDTVWTTSNGGKTWSHASMKVPGALQLTGLAFVDPQHGWAAAEPRGQNDGLEVGRMLLHTIDGGRVWNLVELPEG